MQDYLELLDKSQAAQRARISVVTLERLIARGQGPAVTRIGGRVFIQPCHLTAWVQSQVTPAGGIQKPQA